MDLYDRGPASIVTVSSRPAAKKAKPSRGFGDTIAKMTTALGIKPCGGCKKRQEKLNRAFPYRGKK